MRTGIDHNRRGACRHRGRLAGGRIGNTSANCIEMRPKRTTPAHVTSYLAELVCSNSLGSSLPHKAPGLLKDELRGLGSLILACAEATAVPAGSSLAVDRDLFAQMVTERIERHPNIELVSK